MDRNTVIGFVLLGLLLFAYLFMATKNSQELQKQKQHYEDSVARVKAIQDQQARVHDTSKAAVIDTATGFNKSVLGTEQLVTLENEVVKLVLSSKGGQPKTVSLKQFNNYHGGPVTLVGSGNERIAYRINVDNNQTKFSDELFYTPGNISKNADGSQSVSFVLYGPGGERIAHVYTIYPNSYFIDFSIVANGTDKLFSQHLLDLQWQTQLLQQEKAVKWERQQSQLCYVVDGGFDYHSLSGTDTKKFDKPVNWVSAKQQFFNSTIIAKNAFASGEANWMPPVSDTLAEVSLVKANLQVKLNPANADSVPLQLYYGPNDYKLLSNSNVPKMGKLVNLGQGLYSFVRPLNVYIIMPVFGFFKSFISSYGLAILLLTLFIRLLTSPLVYSSYLSGAKMKALRPEIDIIRKRVNNDQQQVSVEQMKLFREAGVNPLGGCIPALLQIPIFFALYSFFNSNIALRGQQFLWSKDLSVYDAVVNFGFNIPLYGDHVSLFALLAVVTSFLISLYGMSLTPDQSNPAMKYMPYIMPIMLLFFFNSLPSALTWYYTVSNTITLILQFVIQNYIIDHEKILAKLQENRSKPKAKSKWQERLEQMQETQKKVQQLKDKNRR